MILQPNFANIPEELTALPQWVVWRQVERGGEKTKPPFQVDGSFASSTDPQTWTSYEKARDAAEKFDGIGIVLSDDDPYVGLDFDKCRCPAFAWVVQPEVEAHLRSLNSYTELSPSGRGFRVFVKGTLPVKGRKKGGVEAYRSGRYMTVTGHHVAGLPKTIEERQAELDAFCSSVFDIDGDGQEQVQEQQEEAKRTCGGQWRILLAKAFSSSNGDAIRRLYSGDFSSYPSQSEADLALCSHLAFWFGGDAVAIDEAFRESGLFRKKWTVRHGDRTYGQMTIEKAVASTKEFYKPEERTEEKTDETFTEESFSEALNRRHDSYPEPINELAFQGLAGEIVRTVEPHTESDPVAILLQSMIVFGNIIGRGPHFCVEADRHYTNENSVIVGETSKGRKGTSDGIVHSLFRFDHSTHLHAWATEKVKSGLSSGEGVTYHVRDATEKDEGVLDKRLFIRETEFGNVLRVLQRQGNTLSPVIRQAWDSGDLAILTKNNPIRATGAHVSISGHITAAELRHYLFEVEIFNGLANRFLWACVKRSKILPEGGRFHTLDVTKLKAKISQAIEFSRRVKEIRRDPEAREIWISVYEELSSGKQGMAGAVLSRAEAHVMRLAVLYALMDLSKVIRSEHLTAALAFWQYVEASVEYIFGDRTGDPVADRIYERLADCPEGFTRTEVSGLLDRHVKKERIDDAIAMLVRSGKVVIAKEKTAGRPVERIKLA